jgi:hypothetical protein
MGASLRVLFLALMGADGTNEIYVSSLVAPQDSGQPRRIYAKRKNGEHVATILMDDEDVDREIVKEAWGRHLVADRELQIPISGSECWTKNEITELIGKAISIVLGAPPSIGSRHLL